MHDPPNDSPNVPDSMEPTPDGGVFSIGGERLTYMLGWWTLSVPGRVLSGHLADGTPYYGSTTYIVVGLNHPDGTKPHPDEVLDYTAILTIRYHVDSKVHNSADQRKIMTGIRRGNEADQIKIAEGVLTALRREFNLPESEVETLMVRGNVIDFQQAVAEQQPESIHTRHANATELWGDGSHFPGLA